MIIPGSSYTHDASAKTITLSDPYDNVTAEQIVHILNLTTGKFIYKYNNFSNGHPTISVTGGVITYTYDLSALENTDKLQIVVDGSNVIDGGTP